PPAGQRISRQSKRARPARSGRDPRRGQAPTSVLFPDFVTQTGWFCCMGGTVVAATPNANTRRAWPEAAGRWAAGHRQVVEQVIAQPKALFALERRRAKTLGGLLARPATKVVAFTVGEGLNAALGRPLRHLADPLV